MKFLIFSDSHRSIFNMKSVIDRQKEDIDGVIHLGDLYEDALLLTELYPRLIFHAVTGNCDISARYMGMGIDEKLINVDGLKILLLHGHRQMVKSTFTVLEDYAREKDADAVLFGHTHQRCERYIGDGSKPLYMFNPGSVAEPRNGEPSFGFMTVQNGQILFSHGDVYVR